MLYDSGAVDNNLMDRMARRSNSVNFKRDRDDDPHKGLNGLKRIRHKLFWNDPRDELELQPHIGEPLVRKSEIWGFFLFGFGYYTYNNICQSLLFPILMQGSAMAASHLESDHSIPCPDDSANIPLGDRCVVPFGWIQVTPTSYTLLVSVVLTWCGVVISLGVSAIADHGRRSKKMTLFFTFMMCFITCFVFVGVLWPSIWWFTSVNYVLGGMMNTAAMNFYDAMIPNLTKFHPSVIRAQLAFGDNSEEHIIAKTKVQTFLSGGGSASGYIGGLLLTITVALILLFTDSTLLIVGYCAILVAVYIAIVTAFFAKLAVQRTFPPLPPGANKLTYGYVRVGKTIGKARKLKTMFYFLSSWFILGDGLSAATGMAILIAQADLKLGSTSLIIAALIQFVFAGVGMAFWIWVQNSRGMKPKNVVVLNTALFGLLPLYCLLALIPGCPIGLQHEWELYMLATFFGFTQGAIYSSNRVVFAQFIPKGHENELFALYEISSAASCWIAPLVCTAIVQASNSRMTWIFLSTQIYIPAFMMLFVNVEKGRQEGFAFYEAEQAEKKRVADELTLMSSISEGAIGSGSFYDDSEEVDVTKMV
ncbi:Autophagy protein 22 [Gryganskiella cystojenkinii]|nr:Autophagy protein 22 [Gryganskiella cystojenkinii]